MTVHATSCRSIAPQRIAGGRWAATGARGSGSAHLRHASGLARSPGCRTRGHRTAARGFPFGPDSGVVTQAKPACWQKSARAEIVSSVLRPPSSSSTREALRGVLFKPKEASPKTLGGVKKKAAHITRHPIRSQKKACHKTPDPRW